MVMTRFKYIAIGASASGETLVDALAGLGEKNRTIKSIRYVTAIVTGAMNIAKFPLIRAYKNQDQIVDFNTGSFNIGVYSGTHWIEDIKPIMMDLDLVKGDGFQIGLYLPSSTPSGDLQIEYVDKE